MWGKRSRTFSLCFLHNRAKSLPYQVVYIDSTKGSRLSHKSIVRRFACTGTLNTDMVNKFRFFCQIRPVAAFARNQGCHECFLSWKLSPLKNNPLKYMLAAATAAATPPPRISQMFPPWKISHLVKFMLSAASATTSVLYAFSRAKTLPENLLLLYMCCWSFSLPTWSL